jgi:hypothetical protein
MQCKNNQLDESKDYFVKMGNWLNLLEQQMNQSASDEQEIIGWMQRFDADVDCWDVMQTDIDSLEEQRKKSVKDQQEIVERIRENYVGAKAEMCAKKEEFSSAKKEMSASETMQGEGKKKFAFALLFGGFMIATVLGSLYTSRKLF